MGTAHESPHAETTDFTPAAGLTSTNVQDAIEEVQGNIGSGPVTGTGAAGRVAFWSSGSVLTSNGGLYFDAVNTRLGIGTGSPSTTLHVVGIFRTGETSARSFELQTRDALTDFPVPCVRPSTANTVIALDIMPNGNPSEYGANGKAWLDVCDTDVQTGSPAVNTARVGVRATMGAEFGSRAYQGASPIPISFTIHDGSASVPMVGQFSTSGVFGVGSTAPDVSGSGACLHLTGDTLRIGTSRTPASASATGKAGEVCWDSNYIYTCIATNTWKRAALSTW